MVSITSGCRVYPDFLLKLIWILNLNIAWAQHVIYFLLNTNLIFLNVYNFIFMCYTISYLCVKQFHIYMLYNFIFMRYSISYLYVIEFHNYDYDIKISNYYCNCSTNCYSRHFQNTTCFVVLYSMKSRIKALS